MNERAISNIDIDSTKAVLEDLLQKVVHDVSAEDIETLESIRKIYKKTIPFSKRMYVASYLLAQYVSCNVAAVGNTIAHPQKTSEPKANRPLSRPPEQHRGGDGKIVVKIESPIIKGAHAPLAENGQKVSGFSRIKTPKVVISKDDAAAIFISIGRGRRVYPRDLVGLLVNAAGISRDRIGDIRVLSSYSFVQLYKEDADTAIAKLNGYDYRGKQLSVSYSKEKADGSISAASQTPPPDAATSVTEASAETSTRNVTANVAHDTSESEGAK